MYKFIFNSFFISLFCSLLYRNELSFHAIFASAMRNDYSIIPSLIGAPSGIVWFYDNPSQVKTFDQDDPLIVSANQCNSSSFCAWYTSPL